MSMAQYVGPTSSKVTGLVFDHHYRLYISHFTPELRSKTYLVSNNIKPSAQVFYVFVEVLQMSKTLTTRWVGRQGSSPNLYPYFFLLFITILTIFFSSTNKILIFVRIFPPTKLFGRKIY